MSSVRKLQVLKRELVLVLNIVMYL